jgi:hypothetical protein
MENEIVLDALNELKDDVNKINDSYSLTDWKSKATNIMVRIYGKDSSQIQQISDLVYRSGFSSSSESNVRKRKEQALSLIDGLKKEIERFGLPQIQTKEEKNGLHINITQSQNQQTQISLNLLIKSIQEELKGSELNELQSIIDEKGTTLSDKKNKIVDSLKKFGGDVATNIIANILTNPSLFG